MRNIRNKELSFKEKSWSCRLGNHDYGSVFNGRYYYLGCENCFKMHPIWKSAEDKVSSKK